MSAHLFIRSQVPVFALVRSFRQGRCQRPDDYF